MAIHRHNWFGIKTAHKFAWPTGKNLNWKRENEEEENIRHKENKGKKEENGKEEKGIKENRKKEADKRRNK